MRSHSCRRLTVLATLMVPMLVLAACGADSDESTTTTSTTTTSVAQDGSPTPSEMKAVLLGSDDLGSKWMVMQSQAFDSREGIPTLDPGTWCPAAADASSGLGDLAGKSGAITGLRGVDLPKGVSHQISEQLFDTGSAGEFVALVKSGVDACSGAPWTNSNGNVVRVDPLTSPDVGDESVSATTLIATQEEGTDFVFRTRFLVARFGSVVMILQEVDVQESGAAPLMDGGEWGSLVSMAAEKLSGL